MSAPDIAGSGESKPYVPAFRGVLPGRMSGFVADDGGRRRVRKVCQASLSMPRADDMAAVDAVAILESGSGITTTSDGIANKLQAAFPDVQAVGGMSHPGKLKVADGRVLAVEKKHARCGPRCTPAGIWSPWILFLRRHAPGDDDVILGNPTLKRLDIDEYDSFRGRARERAALTGIDIVASWQCRRVTVSFDAL